MTFRVIRWTAAACLVAWCAATSAAQTIRPLPRPSPAAGRRGAPPAPAAPPLSYQGSIIDVALHVPAGDASRQTTLNDLDQSRVVLSVIAGPPDSLRPWVMARGSRFIV